MWIREGFFETRESSFIQGISIPSLPKRHYCTIGVKLRRVWESRRMADASNCEIIWGSLWLYQIGEHTQPWRGSFSVLFVENLLIYSYNHLSVQTCRWWNSLASSLGHFDSFFGKDSDFQNSQILRSRWWLRLFDELTDKHEVYKVETVGDAYIAGQAQTECKGPSLSGSLSGSGWSTFDVQEFTTVCGAFWFRDGLLDLIEAKRVTWSAVVFVCLFS